MAKFVAQGGGFKLPFSEGACDLRDSFQCRLGGGSSGGALLFKSPFDVRGNGGSKRKLARWSCRASFVGRKGRRLGGEEEEGFKDVDEEDDGSEEFERDELSCCRGLVLDISYRPINVVCWRRAICLEFMEKADVLEYYDQTISSPRGSFYIPAVLRVPHLLQVKRRRVKYNLSRKSIFHRDSYTCQYCSSSENLTIDHVLPISKGGEWKWENLVTACAKCNTRKGQETLERANMKLLKIPKTPKDYDILAIPLTTAALMMLMSRKGVPEEWLQYLSKPAP